MRPNVYEAFAPSHNFEKDSVKDCEASVNRINQRIERYAPKLENNVLFHAGFIDTIDFAG